MTITNDRKRELKWEVIDASFNLLEYYEELRGKDNQVTHIPFLGSFTFK